MSILSYEGKSRPSTDNIVVTTGDFDGYGNPDVAVLVQFENGAILNTTSSPNASVAFVFYGNGDGTFSSPVLAGVFDYVYTRIYAASLSKNGLSDLVFQINGTMGVDASPEGDRLGVVRSRTTLAGIFNRIWRSRM